MHTLFVVAALMASASISVPTLIVLGNNLSDTFSEAAGSVNLLKTIIQNNQ